MKYFVLAGVFFISASIIYSAMYITSGMIMLIENSVGGQLPSQTQPLLIWSIILVVLGVLSLLIGFLKKD